MTLKEFLDLGLVYCSYEVKPDFLTMTPRLWDLDCGIHVMVRWHYSKLCHCNMPENTKPVYLRNGYREEEQEDGSIELVPTPKPGWYVPGGEWDGQIPFTDTDLLNAEVREISDKYGNDVYPFGVLIDLQVNWEN